VATANAVGTTGHFAATNHFFTTKNIGEDQGMKSLTGERMAITLGILLLSGCVRLEVATPEKPITINMNVKIEHEIQIKVDKDVENLLKNQSNLF
jgi:hypothetical protein